MVRTANLRRQHDAALTIACEILDVIERMDDAPSHEDAYAATLLLAKLTGLLRIHFAQEDQLLYPSLMAEARGGVAAVARSFFEEMGQIGPAFAAFSEKWRAQGAIAAEPALFRGESRALLAALADRIRRENDELYPLADKLHEEPTAIRAA